MGKPSNWSVLKKQSDSDSLRYRDVYEDQQLERSEIEAKQSPVSRIILAVVASVLTAGIVYVLVSMICFGISSVQSSASSTQRSADQSSIHKTEVKYDPEDVYNYIGEKDDFSDVKDGGGLKEKYFAKGKDGKPVDNRLYDNASDVPEPDWYKVEKHAYEEYAKTPAGQAEAQKRHDDAAKRKLGYWMMPSLTNVFISLLGGLICFLILYQLLMKNLEAQNLLNDTSDINQYKNDQHIALPEEVQRKFDIFPDVGAHTNVQPSSMISHMALTNKGINPVQMSVRAKEDVKDEDGEVEYFKGEVMYDDDGNVITETKPMFNEKFMNDLFTTSGIPANDKTIRKFYDPDKIPYNPKNYDRDKLQGFDTFADVINKDWVIPSYETQRPAGVYMVDVQPVNTMVLAITRAGKGQTVIEMDRLCLSC